MPEHDRGAGARPDTRRRVRPLTAAALGAVLVGVLTGVGPATADQVEVAAITGGLPAGPQLSRPTVVRLPSGTKEAYARGVQGEVVLARQVAPGSDEWTSWTSLGGIIQGAPAAAIRPNGQAGVAVLGNDERIYVNTRGSLDGGWSGWTRLGDGRTFNRVNDQAIQLVFDADGRMEVFGTRADSPYVFQVYRAYQTSVGGGWSGWEKVGTPGNFAQVPRAAVNADGRVELVVANTVSTDLYYNRQTSPGGEYGNWVRFYTSQRPYLELNPIGLHLTTNADGRLEVFTTGARSTFNPTTSAFGIYHAWQTSPGGSWTSPVVLPGSEAQELSLIESVSINGNGQMQLSALTRSGLSYVADQRNWASWRPNYLAESLTGATTLDLDRRMYVLGQPAVYTIIGPPDAEIRWSSWKDGVSTGEVDAFYGQRTGPDGTWTGTAGPFTAGQVAAAFTKQVKVGDERSDRVTVQVRPSGPLYTLTAEHSGRCAAVADGSREDGAAIVQQACVPGAANQEFLLDQRAPGQYWAVAAHALTCVNVLVASTADGARAGQWSCVSGAANQLWRTSAPPADDATVTLAAGHSNRCLSVLGASTSAGAALVQSGCMPGAANQLWRLHRVG